MAKAWSFLVKKESLACQITYPFNIRWVIFENEIKKIALQKQPIFLLNGKPVTPLSKEVHGQGIKVINSPKIDDAIGRYF